LIKINEYDNIMRAIEELNKQVQSNGCIHMVGNFFANVEKSTDKAVLIDIHGSKNWFPKSAFQMKDMGENLYCFGIKSFFANKFNGTN
jgi:hypothetical protein